MSEFKVPHKVIMTYTPLFLKCYYNNLIIVFKMFTIEQLFLIFVICFRGIEGTMMQNPIPMMNMYHMCPSENGKNKSYSN